MDAVECIRTRMSIRKFKAEPVPMTLLKTVIDTAKWSPSYKNTQPWEVVIVSGKKKEELSKILIGLVESRTKPSPDIPEPQSWPPVIEARIDALMKRRSESTGVDLYSLDALRKAKIVNFQFYGAPHGMFLFQESSLPEWSIFDMGLFAQSLMLAAHAHGLGTVPQAFVTDYSRHVKDFLDIPETKRLVLGMSVGYPDLESPVNQFRTDRVETDEIVRFVE
jgi:nitroreductase